MAVKPIPDGHRVITPYLILPEAGSFVEFAERAFGAKERVRVPDSKGLIRYAELELGDGVIMLSDATEQFPAWPAMLHLYVTDVDAAFKRAIDAGGTSLREPADQDDGDRRGGLSDRWGNQWWLATHIKDVALA